MTLVLSSNVFFSNVQVVWFRKNNFTCVFYDNYDIYMILLRLQDAILNLNLYALMPFCILFKTYTQDAIKTYWKTIFSSSGFFSTLHVSSSWMERYNYLSAFEFTYLSTHHVSYIDMYIIDFTSFTPILAICTLYHV